MFDLCGKMSDNIRQDIIYGMERLPITSDGIDMEDAGLKGGTTTWTYAINENIFQFSALRRVYDRIMDRFTGEDGLITKRYKRKANHR